MNYTIKPASRCLRENKAYQSFRIAKFRGPNGTHALLRDAEGVIYSTRRPHSEYDIRDTSAPERAAWCRLTGMTNKALAAEVRRHKEEADIRDAAMEIEKLRDMATCLGFDIVERAK